MNICVNVKERKGKIKAKKAAKEEKERFENMKAKVWYIFYLRPLMVDACETS